MVTVTALKALRLAPVLLGLYIAAQPRATLPSVWALVPSVLGPHLLYAALYAVILLASARYLLFRRRDPKENELDDYEWMKVVDGAWCPPAAADSNTALAAATADRVALVIAPTQAIAQRILDRLCSRSDYTLLRVICPNPSPSKPATKNRRTAFSDRLSSIYLRTNVSMGRAPQDSKPEQSTPTKETSPLSFATATANGKRIDRVDPGEIYEISHMVSILKDAQCIYMVPDYHSSDHCLDLASYSEPELVNSLLLSLKTLAVLARNLGVDRFIHVSTAAALASPNWDHLPPIAFSEEMLRLGGLNTKPASRFAKCVQEAENFLMSFNRTGGLKTVILRPHMLYDTAVSGESASARTGTGGGLQDAPPSSSAPPAAAGLAPEVGGPSSGIKRSDKVVPLSPRPPGICHLYDIGAGDWPVTPLSTVNLAVWMHCADVALGKPGGPQRVSGRAYFIGDSARRERRPGIPSQEDEHGDRGDGNGATATIVLAREYRSRIARDAGKESDGALMRLLRLLGCAHGAQEFRPRPVMPIWAAQAVGIIADVVSWYTYGRIPGIPRVCESSSQVLVETARFPAVLKKAAYDLAYVAEHEW